MIVRSKVAPFTGAWIETNIPLEQLNLNSVAPFTGAWIETRTNKFKTYEVEVAPFTGAWIETEDAAHIEGMAQTSLPSRERG